MPLICSLGIVLITTVRRTCILLEVLFECVCTDGWMKNICTRLKGHYMSADHLLTVMKQQEKRWKCKSWLTTGECESIHHTDEQVKTKQCSIPERRNWGGGFEKQQKRGKLNQIVFKKREHRGKWGKRKKKRLKDEKEQEVKGEREKS